LQKKYENVYIFCLFRNRFFIKQLYENYNNIHIIILNANHDNRCLAEINDINALKSSVSDYDLIETGYYTNYLSVSVSPFWKCFYEQMNLPYEIRYEYLDFNRNIEKEEDIYKKLIDRYGKNYIFVHDHRNVKYQQCHPRSNVNLDINLDIPIFHPNFNYYSNYPDHKYYYLWEETLFLSDNLLDYGKIIENATEIHINDSAFSCYCPYLNLMSVKNKSISSKLNMVDYHNSFKDWKINN
jgi:hypothetical protein